MKCEGKDTHGNASRAVAAAWLSTHTQECWASKAIIHACHQQTSKPAGNTPESCTSICTTHLASRKDRLCPATHAVSKGNRTCHENIPRPLGWHKAVLKGAVSLQLKYECRQSVSIIYRQSGEKHATACSKHAHIHKAATGHIDTRTSAGHDLCH